MLPTPVLLESLERRFGLTWLSHQGEQINVRCPYCHKRGMSPDESGHLGINTRINKAHCVKCGWGHGNASAWLESFDVHLSVNFRDVIRETDDLKKVFETKKIQFDSSTIPLPKEFKLISKHQDDFFTKSLEDKGVSKELITRSKVGFCDSGKYEGYVIFPFFEEEETVYFQGRAAYPDLLDNPKTKKKNPDSKNGMGKNSWLYGIDRAKKGCKLVLVEGTLDQLSSQDHLDRCHDEEYCSVSLQGTSLSFPSPDRHPLNSQWGKIKYFNPSEVLVMFDPDAYNKAKELAKILCITGLKARAIRLSEGDPNEIMRLRDGDSILKRAIANTSEFDDINIALSNLHAP